MKKRANNANHICTILLCGATNAFAGARTDTEPSNKQYSNKQLLVVVLTVNNLFSS